MSPFTTGYEKELAPLFIQEQDPEVPESKDDEEDDEDKEEEVGSEPTQ